MFKPEPLAYHEPMRIVCPSCAATYDVPVPQLAPGRSVRCARCSTDWTPVPDLVPVRESFAAPVVPETKISPAIQSKFPTTLLPATPAFVETGERADLINPPRTTSAMTDPIPGAATLSQTAPRFALKGGPDPHEAAAEEAEAPDDFIQDDAEFLPAPMVPRPPATASMFGWVVTIGLLIWFGWLAVVQRDRIIRAWPASTRAYAAVGLLRPQ